MEGLHSPFGQLHQIISNYGWSLKEVMWKVNFPTMMMMSSDAPRYVTGKKNKKVEVESEDQLNALINKKYR